MSSSDRTRGEETEGTGEEGDQHTGQPQELVHHSGLFLFFPFFFSFFFCKADGKTGRIAELGSR